MFETDNVSVHVHGPGAGADNVLGSTILENVNHLFIWSFAASFSPAVKRLSNSFSHIYIEDIQIFC